jgi:hypothetical protein
MPKLSTKRDVCLDNIISTSNHQSVISPTFGKKNNFTRFPPAILALSFSDVTLAKAIATPLKEQTCGG